jgi:hypothetical protein
MKYDHQKGRCITLDTREMVYEHDIEALEKIKKRHEYRYKEPPYRDTTGLYSSESPLPKEPGTHRQDGLRGVKYVFSPLSTYTVAPPAEKDLEEELWKATEIRYERHLAAYLDYQSRMIGGSSYFDIEGTPSPVEHVNKLKVQDQFAWCDTCTDGCDLGAGRYMCGWGVDSNIREWQKRNTSPLRGWRFLAEVKESCPGYKFRRTPK